MQDPARQALPIKVTAAGATDIGRGREHNEDTVLIRADLNLYMLADGAGGHNAGNVASALATTSVANYLEGALASIDPSEFDAFGLSLAARKLASAIQHANRDIMEIAESSNKRRGMGTTVVAIVAVPGSATLHLAHVGDSRCYRLRANVLEPMTHDHSLINDVLALKPDMDDRALSKLPGNVVTRALGMEDPVRVSVRSHAMVPGDRYLLCSDGLTDALDDAEIGDVLRLPNVAEDQVRLLIDLALRNGASDNIAAVVLACDASADRTVMSRPAPRPKRAPRTELPADDGPEIVIMGYDEAEPDASFHVVPAQTANEGLMEALDAFDEMVGARPAGGRGKGGASKGD